MHSKNFQALLEATPDAMAITTPAGTIVLVNEEVERISGRSRAELVGASLPELLGLRADGPDVIPITGEYSLRSADGPATEVEVRARPIETEQGSFHVHSLRDLSERRRLEMQLNQSQKMEAVGRLAGGVAHDFNNMLSVISGYCDLILHGPVTDRSVRARLIEVSRAAERATALTRRLLVFSRKQAVAPVVLDLGQLASGLTQMLDRLVGEDIRLVSDLAGDLGLVKADPSHLEQVIANLVVNSRDAMPCGGTVTLCARNVHRDAPSLRAHGELRPGDYVMLEVRDTGDGMTADVLAHMWEPFFTTKELGHGTGLGLSTVYGIVAQSGGFVEVDSAPESGTSVRVFLPVVAESPRRLPHSWPTRELPSGGETILLVEDEPSVRGMVREILVGCGYRVLEAGDPDAVAVVRSCHPGRIDLLVTDVVMPRMSGRDVAGTLGYFHPEMRVLYMSGYTKDEVLRRGITMGETPFLAKPFSPQQLARAVRDVLDSDRMTPPSSWTFPAAELV